MNKELRDLSWACLPQESRDNIRSSYIDICEDNEIAAKLFLEDIFGYYNLISYIEPEEMLIVSRKKVQEIYSELASYITNKRNPEDNRAEALRKIAMLQKIFGNKCLPDKLPVQVEPKFNIGDDVIFEGKPYKITGCQHFKGRITYSINIPNGEYKCFFNESDLEPYTDPETKPLSVGDKARIKGEDKVRVVYRVLPDGSVMFGDKGNTYPAEDIELVEPNTQKESSTSSLKRIQAKKNEENM